MFPRTTVYSARLSAEFNRMSAGRSRETSITSRFPSRPNSLTPPTHSYRALHSMDGPQWGIAQKQTGADTFTLGGTLSANGHGRGLTLAPFIQDVEALDLLQANGTVIRCSRRENRELFGLVIGGYGLFGVITEVTLRLVPRTQLERVVEILDAEALPQAFEQRIAQMGGASANSSLMISELYVPRNELPQFLAEAANDLRSLGIIVIYGTVRLIEKDTESFLPWATQAYPCVIFNLSVDHSPNGLERARIAFRSLIDRALARGGNYFLTCHRFANRAQLQTGYPKFDEFLAMKKQYDPTGLFQSDWYRHYQREWSG